MNQPLVTINILSFNRKEDLRVTLSKVFEQDYKNIEVIVVDNASIDGSVEMVKTEYPGVNVIVLGKNIGIAGWNEGFKMAKGKYILVLDDDSYPGKNSIEELVKTAIRDDNIGVIASKVKNMSTGIIDPLENNDNLFYSFIGCGALISKNIFSQTGLFSEKLFLYFHEIDFSFRLINCGYKIAISESSIIYHRISQNNRNYLDNNSIDKRKVYYDIRNTIYLLLSYFSFRTIIFRLIRIIIGRIYFGIQNHLFLKIILGIYHGFKLSLSSFDSKNTLKLETQRYFMHGAIFGGFFFWNGNYGNKSSNMFLSLLKK